MSETFETHYRANPETYGDDPSSHLVRLVQKYHILPPGQALDIGCGQGRNAVYLARHGFSVAAIDGSPSAIARLRERSADLGLDIKSSVGDIRSVEIEEARYQLIVANTCLDHIDRECGDRLASRIMRGLAAGGAAFVSGFTTADPGYSGEEDASDTAMYVRRYFGPGELRGLFAELTVLAYHEEVALDETHGRPHYHGIARLLARRPVA